MNEGYWFALTLTFPTPAAKSAWLATRLASQLDALTVAAIETEDPVPAFGEGAHEPGILGPDVTGQGLLDWLAGERVAGNRSIGVIDAPARLVLTGYATDYDSFGLLQPPLFCAAAAARATGGSARLGFIADHGQSDGPVTDTLIADGAAPYVRARQWEWQDTSAESLAALADAFGIERARVAE